jgi:hypothetical protein
MSHLPAAQLGAPPPDLTTYRGLPVTWGAWQPGLLVTHMDYRCEACGLDLGPQTSCVGTVPEVPDGPRSGELAGRPVKTLMAFRCAGCGYTTGVAFADPGW